MYLHSIEIKNFRCIKELKVEFKDGLNVIIGENNSGKTAVIDALRICLGWGNPKRELFVTRNDYYIDTKNHDGDIKPIEFQLTYYPHTDKETGIFYDLHSINDGKDELNIKFKFSREDRNGIEKTRYAVWGGENEGQSISPEVLDLIGYVHLGALRNASQDLRPTRGNRIGQLMTNLETNEDKQKSLAGIIHESIESHEEWQALIGSARKIINEHLEKTTISDRTLTVDLSLLPYEFTRIVENLRARIPIFDSLPEGVEQKYFDIYQNGLGFNNLIYIAAILGDMAKRKENVPNEYSALLIEEPEAHLQPQLQSILFDYFNSWKSKFQVFITSHSPTITAKTNLDSLTILQLSENNVTCFSPRNSELNKSEKKMLQRYLDVTKAQLLFARGVILVEGISEALLMPIFAQIMSKAVETNDKYHLDKNGVEVVNIDGVSFRSFALLFNSDEVSKRLISRCVIITDSDTHLNGEKSSRASNAESLRRNNLDVCLSNRTFEHDLYIAGDNKDLIQSVYKEMHPKTDIKDADDFQNKLESNKDKAEFAQNLALRLEELLQSSSTCPLEIPAYIQRSIKWATNKD